MDKEELVLDLKHCYFDRNILCKVYVLYVSLIVSLSC